MPAAILLLFFLQAPAPFWETKAPRNWTDAEIELMMKEPPWGAVTVAGNVTVFLASARPMREAEEELFLRQTKNGEIKTDEEDYHSYIQANPGKHIVLAVRMDMTQEFSIPKEAKRMEKECFLRVGKQKVRPIGYFPPTPADPFFRLLFPRIPLTGLRSLNFGLYLPGVHKPFQDVELPVKGMTYRGQTEY